MKTSPSEHPMHAPLHSRPERPRKTRGFSLVEVTLALGFLSCCILTILGLIPAGLATTRQAIDLTTQTQIAQQIASETILTPFSNLDTFVSTPIFFTDTAVRQAGQDAKTFFKVELLRQNTTFPGSESANNLNSNLATVKVVISRLVGTPSSSSFAIQVPNSGN